MHVIVIKLCELIKFNTISSGSSELCNFVKFFHEVENFEKLFLKLYSFTKSTYNWRELLIDGTWKEIKCTLK